MASESPVRLTAGGLTVSAKAELVSAPITAVIFTEPAPTAVASPLAIVATVASLLIQLVTALPWISATVQSVVLLSPYTQRAENESVLPIVSVFTLPALTR